MAFALVVAATRSLAGPEGGIVVGGSATISGQGSAAVIVNQSSPSAVINWHTFNVGANESVKFNQPSSSAFVLNRVTGGLGPSEILGSITANGKVFVINRDGILFGPGAVINTAGFVASTNDIKNSDFMAGRFNFNIPGRPDASIVNQGTITAASGGFAALVAPGVRNSGTISATLGTVALAAGNGFTLDLYGDKLITLAVKDEIAAKVVDVGTGRPLTSLVTNDGKIRANGGRVELTAAAARAVVDSVINTSGVIKANAIGTRNGMIVLSAATGASKPTGAPVQTVRVSGRLSAAGRAKGTSGGTIQVTGESIKVAAARIDASGRAGGGKVLIGGDWAGGKGGSIANGSARLENYAIPTASTVSVDGATTIDASARAGGSGGKVIVWADSDTTFAGTILARGGLQSGNGGFVEVSGHNTLAFSGHVDTLAPQGKAGTLLLDPRDIIIQSTGTDSVTASGGTFTSNVDSSILTVATLEAALASTNVVVQTGASGSQEGNITVANNVNWSSANSLTLLAHRNIQFNLGVVLTNTGGAAVVLRADSQGAGIGTVSFGTGAGISTAGNVAIYFNPSVNPAGSGVNPYSYVAPTENFSGNVTGGGTLQTYMLVNTGNDLQNIQNNLTGSYALGKDIIANAGHVAIGSVMAPFDGVLDGKAQAPNAPHYKISGLTGGNGLFGVIGSEGEVRNLELAGINLAPYYLQTIGGLANVNEGIISGVTASGIINGAGFYGVTAGGLVGRNTGQISGSTSSVIVTVGDGNTTPPSNINTAGGLVGLNLGTISGSSSSGTIAGGVNSFVGGLVGRNDGTVTNSSSSSMVSGVTGNGGSDIGSAVGGLVGLNTALITGSFATGSVSGSSQPAAEFAIILGGLVGLHNSPGQIVNSWSSSAVSGSGQVEAGGLVGGNFGSISGSTATGPVSTSLASSGQIGGLVGFNAGTITTSRAEGPVDGIGNVLVGGLVGFNDTDGSITFSHATGAVSTTVAGALDHIAGGFVGINTGFIASSSARGPVTSLNGDVILGGFAGFNDLVGTIANSFATGNVTANSAHNAMVGGFVGANSGTINANSNSVISFASGNVTVDAVRGIAGGFVGFNFTGSIDHAFAQGGVTVTGNVGVAGGFVGMNSGFTNVDGTHVGALNQTFATGNVAGSANHNVLGGFAGLNTNHGTITQAYATGAVNGPGTGVVAGFAAVNIGTIEQAYAIGKLSGGSIKGGLVGASSSLPLPPPITGDVDFAPTLTGAGTAASSYWDTQSTGVATSAGGQARTTQQLTSALPAGFDNGVWTIKPNQTYPYFPWAQPVPGGSEAPPTDVPSQTQVLYNLVNSPQFANPTLPTVLASLGGIRLPQFAPLPPLPGVQPPPGQAFPPISFPRLFDIPPIGETRFVSDQVLLQIFSNRPIAQVEEAVRGLGLILLDSQRLPGTTDTIVLQFRIANGQDVRDIIRQLASIQIVALAQPNYIYVTGQQQPAPDPAASPASRGDTRQQGDAAQYILQKLGLIDVHRQARGANIPIAVIDSEIDANHPDLQGVITQRYSAHGAPEKAHSHGTGMAGAIASRQRLIGTAPSSRILAVHAFSTKAATPESTTFAILKGLDWSVTQGARIVNMSFAGPKDPSLERAIKVAYDKGIVLVAAAGNAGPKSPPLYPGADPNVIAVTATDVNDRIFSGANRGRHVAVSAPGVDILVPAPDSGYQLTTGTSVAAAEVSGIVALLLERNPRLTPADVRRILTNSARRLSTGDRDDDFGHGLVDPQRALQSADPRTVSGPALRQR